MNDAKEKAKRKERTKYNSQGDPVQSFNSLLQDLGTLCRNHVRADGTEFSLLTTPTPLHTRVFELLGVSLTA